jgi:endonuclease/exonuclease/phosphatase family metal-dependent hydrolase
MSKWKLNVCTYNVMLTVPEPIRFNGQVERAMRIPECISLLDAEIGGLDVIVFVELISPDVRQTVINKMQKLGWPYISKKISANPFFDSFKTVSGGVIIVSKYPIIYEYTYVFEDACEGYDCTACKGIVFCRIQKGKNVFSILGTHFQAWNTPRAQQIRRLQAEQCSKVINSMNIPSDEPIIMLGDFNIDFYTRQIEIQKLSEIMNIQILDKRKDSYEFSSDPSTNKLMGNDEDMMYATDLFPKGCYAEYMNTMTCPCCPQEWLDYIVYSTRHLRPCFAEMYVHKMKSQLPFRMKFNVSTERITDDLSDHYPVVGQFIFDDTPFSNRQIFSSLPSQRKISHIWKKTFVILLVIFVITIATIVLYVYVPRN